MKVIGVDPATLLAGLAYAQDGVLLDIDIWKGNEKDSRHRRISQFYYAVHRACSEFKPDLVCVAESSFLRNMDTVRALAQAEAAAILGSMHNGNPVVTAKDTQIRSILFPNKKLKKDEIYLPLKKQYNELKWLAQNRGGQDQADAAAAALTGHTILERKLR